MVDDAKVKDPLERERLARVFEKGLETAVGTVLPHPARSITASDTRRWKSGPWFLRSEKCYLIPGDSALGYRLPLDSLPWAAAGGYPTSWPSPIPMVAASRPAAARCLPPRAGACAARNERVAEDAKGDAEARREAWRRALAPDLGLGLGVGHSAGNVVRTAMAFEPRDGHLLVFMPPTECMEDYLDLVTAIEDTAEELGQPVFLEGYTPPGTIRGC